MNVRKVNLLAIAILVSTASGCASYRTDSNISTAPTTAPAPTVAATTPAPISKVLISEDALPNRKYKEIGPIEVSVKKLTIFHKDPTKEQANEALIEKATVIGADAVVNVTYKSGVGFTTWGYMDASGTGVKLID